MRIELAKLRAAIADQISADLASRLGSADLPSEIDADDVGALLAEALHPGLGPRVGHAALDSVRITFGPASVVLGPEEAIQHPMLRAWLPLGLGEALAMPIVSAASMAALAPGQPNVHWITVEDRGDAAPRGTAVFAAPTLTEAAQVVATYGTGPDTALTRVSRLDGSALAMAGWALHGLRKAPPPAGDPFSAMPAATKH
jgi:hypothetical protein